MTADAGSPPRSKQQLIHRVFEEWRKIPEFFIKQLYASISKRLSTVVTARSYSTKYLFDLKVTSVFNFELWNSKKLYLRYSFIELVFLFVCPLADKTRANQATTKLIGVIRHLLASEVLQYFCPPSVFYIALALPKVYTVCRSFMAKISPLCTCLTLQTGH